MTAPEMVQGSGYGFSTDWWSLGILIYDMLVGKTPFKANNQPALLQKILKEKIKYPSYLTAEAHSLLKGVCFFSFFLYSILIYELIS